MGYSVFPAPSAASGLTVGRFPAAIGNPFNIPAGLTLQATVTTTTTYTAGQLPAQVWVVIIGGGGAGGSGASNAGGGGGGGACIGWVDVPSAGITATIGAGGTGSSASAGTQGGNTNFGSYIAYGGGGGAAGSSYPLDTANVYPKGPGAGWGGPGDPTGLNVGSSLYRIPSGSAPFMTSGGAIVSPATTTSFWNNGFWNPMSISQNSNYNGGGGGSCRFYSYGIAGGNGLTGGGGQGQGAGAGGSSYRDGGITATFAGGAGGGSGGGGGAGLLAAGGTGGVGGVGGVGGSGGGAGGGGYTTAYWGGNGGNGCVLIYY